MTKPRYVIHIGPMKTASTYLQRCIGGAAEDLKTHDVYVPRELTNGVHLNVHNPVLNALRNKERFDKMKPKVAAVNAAGHGTVLLSSEFFVFATPERLLRLRELLGTDDVTIAYMCRRWSDRITSLCFQSVFYGHTRTLPEFAARLMAGEDDEGDLDYALVWQRWADVFGRDALKIVPFSNIVDGKADIFDRFCTDVLGITDVPEPPQMGRKAWVSSEPQEAELVRALNVIHAQHGGRVDPAMYRGFRALSKKLDLAPLFDAVAECECSFVLDDRNPSLDAVYARLEGFADRLSSTRDGAHMFTRKARKASYFGQDYLLRDGVLERLRDLYKQIVAAAEKEPALAAE
jgi:hypothetical protein